MTAGIASAVAVPALDSMSATPGAALPDFRFVRGTMPREVLAVVSDHARIVRFNLLDGICQGHVASRVMMAIRLAVRCTLHKLGPCHRVGKRRASPAGHFFTF